MTKENTQRIQRLFSILLSIVIVIAGICLIVACVDIYHSGEQPFSREAVANAFKPIAIPVYLCLILTIIGFIWDFFSPVNPRKNKNEKPYRFILRRIYETHDVAQCDDSIRDAISTENKKRKNINIVCTSVVCAVTVIFLIYACNNNNYDSTDINGSVINAMWILIPCSLIAFGCGLFSVISNEKSILKEIDLVKKAPIINKAKEESSDISIKETTSSTKATNIVRIVVLVVAVALIAFGYFTDGTADVLTKAINICTECIGLG